MTDEMLATIVAEETAEIIADWLEKEYTGPHMDASVRRAAKRIRAGDWKKSLGLPVKGQE